MKLHIDEERRIKSIQNQFSEVYPFLKIEFFRNLPLNNKPAQKAEKIDPSQKIKLVGKINEHNNIDISKQRTVAQLEKDFKELFGVKAQVYRKSGNYWVETTLTDDWTLEQQNTEGQYFSSHY
jgi:hypothetical protein